MGGAARRNFYDRNSNSSQVRTLVADETDQEVSNLSNKLRSIPPSERALELARLLKQAKTDTDLQFIIRKLVSNGMWLLELQEAQKLLIARPIDFGTRTTHPLIKQFLAEQEKAKEEKARKRLSKKLGRK